MGERRSSLTRKTRETDIQLELNLDGAGLAHLHEILRTAGERQRDDDDPQGPNAPHRPSPHRHAATHCAKASSSRLPAA